MSQQQMTVKSESPSYAFLLFVLFLILKLCGVIHWSWWWVTAPLWIGVLALLVFGMLAFTVAFLVTTHQGRKAAKAQLRKAARHRKAHGIL